MPAFILYCSKTANKQNIDKIQNDVHTYNKKGIKEWN